MLAVRTAHRSEAAVGAAGAQCEAGCVVERHLQCTRTCTRTVHWSHTQCTRASTQCPMHVPMLCPCCAHAVPRGLPMQMQMQMQMQTRTQTPEADVGMCCRSWLPRLTALGLSPVSSHAPCRGCSGVPAQARSPTCVRG